MGGRVGGEASEDEHGDLVEIHVVERLEVRGRRAEQGDQLKGGIRDRQGG